MHEQIEKDLNRLTLVGWGVLVANMLMCIVVVPLIIVNVWPGVFELRGRSERWAMAAGFLLVGGAGFFAWKWLLERFGITVVRPPQPDPPCTRKQIR
jgi:hypothetical protein